MNVDRRYREVLDYLVEPKTHDYAGDKTICYLTFSGDDILYVKRMLRTVWIDLAKNKNIEVVELSIQKVLQDFFEEDDYRIDAGDTDDMYEMEEVYDDLGNNVKKQEVIETAIRKAQIEVKKKDNTVLFITDLEAIHPFTRFGPIEQKLYSDIEVPMVVFYPGERSGSALKFLGFYPEDGNYRSKHF